MFTFLLNIPVIILNIDDKILDNNNEIVTVTSLDGKTNSASNNSVSLLPTKGSKSTKSTSTYYYSTDWE